MGRKKKYYTKEEKLEAQRKWQMDHYERNKAKILKKAKERYRLKKIEEQRREKRRKMYGEAVQAALISSLYHSGRYWG